MSEAETGFGGRPARTPPDSSANAIPPQHDPTAPLVVLVAEDEAPIAQAIGIVIEDAGYLPVLAAHGRQALELYHQRHPALVITDLMMPYMSGDQLIQQIHADAANNGHPAPPIILITAAGTRHIEGIQADVVLRKPFDIYELEAQLHRFLQPKSINEDHDQ